jgi:hypothetical protein
MMTMMRSLLVALALLSSAAVLAEQLVEDRIEGTLRKVDGHVVIDTGRLYLVTNLTKVFDSEGRTVSYHNIPFNRGMVVLSATAGTAGSMPIALEAEVMEPH